MCWGMLYAYNSGRELVSVLVSESETVCSYFSLCAQICAHFYEVLNKDN